MQAYHISNKAHYDMDRRQYNNRHCCTHVQRNILRALVNRQVSIDIRPSRVCLHHWLCSTAVGWRLNSEQGTKVPIPGSAKDEEERKQSDEESGSADSNASLIRTLGIQSRWERGFESYSPTFPPFIPLDQRQQQPDASAGDNNNNEFQFNPGGRNETRERGILEQVPIAAIDRPQNPSGSILSMDQSANGTELASGHGDHSVRVWSIYTDSSQLRHVLPGHSRTPCSVRYHPLLEHLLATGDLAGEVIIWDTNKGDRLASFDFNKPAAVMERIASLSWFPSQQHLSIAITHRKLCYLWVLAYASNSNSNSTSLPSSSIAADSEPSSPTPTFTSTNPTDLLDIVRREKSRRETAKRKHEQQPTSNAPVDDQHVDKKIKVDEQSAAVSTSASANVSSPVSAHASAMPVPLTPFSAAAAAAYPVVHEGPLPSHWPTLASLIHRMNDGANSSLNKPTPIIKSRFSWRYVHFHQNGEYLLLAERSHLDPAPGVNGYNRNNFILWIYSTDASKFSLNSSSNKHEMRLLGSIEDISFFSESGVAVSGDKLATCQMYKLSNVQKSIESPTGLKPNPNTYPVVPSLAIFSLAPNHIGEVLMRVELDSFSFGDLTCVAFSPRCENSNGSEYLAVAYQMSNSRNLNRNTRLEYDAQMKQQQQRKDALTEVGTESRNGQSSSNPPGLDAEEEDSMPVARRRPNSRVRFGKLSSLTRDANDEALKKSKVFNEEKANELAQALTKLSASAPPEWLDPLAPTSFPALTIHDDFRPSSSYDSFLNASLEDHTFLAMYRCSDLAPVAQFTADWRVEPMRRSVNVLMFHSQQLTMGVLAAMTSGEILTFSPVTTMDEESNDEESNEVSSRKFFPEVLSIADNRCLPLDSRTSLAEYIHKSAKDLKSDFEIETRRRNRAGEAILTLPSTADVASDSDHENTNSSLL